MGWLSYHKLLRVGQSVLLSLAWRGEDGGRPSRPFLFCCAPGLHCRESRLVQFPAFLFSITLITPITHYWYLSFVGILAALVSSFVASPFSYLPAPDFPTPDFSLPTSHSRLAASDWPLPDRGRPGRGRRSCPQDHLPCGPSATIDDLSVNTLCHRTRRICFIKT